MRYKAISITLGILLSTYIFAPTASATTLFPSGGGTGSTTLSGLLKGAGTSPVTTAVNGTDFTLIAAQTCSAGQHVSAIAANGSVTCSNDTGTGGSGLSTTSPVSSSNLLVYSSSGAGSAFGVATSTLTAGSGLTGSFTQIGSGGSLALDNTGNWAGTWQTFSPSHFQVAGTYLTSYDAFTHGISGYSATSSVLYAPLQSGTSTIGTLNATSTATVGTLNGLIGGNNGLLYAFATSTIKTSQITNDSGFLTSAVTSVGATWPVQSSGGTTPTISWAGLATSSNLAAGEVHYSTGVNTFADVATSSIANGTGITVTNGSTAYVIGSQPTINCNTANASTFGCLAAADWTTFNNKISWGAATSTSANQFVYTDANGKLTSAASSSIKLSGFNNDSGFITGNQTITLSGAVSGSGSTAITTSYAGVLGNTLGGTGIDSSALTGVVKVTAGTWAAVGAQTCTNQFVRAMSAAYIATCATVSLTADVTGTLPYGNGGTNQTTYTAGNILYAGSSAFQSIATSSISVSAGLTTSGTLGSQVGGTSLTLKQIENRSFSYSTTTAWTGTTTISLGIGYGEVWNNLKCGTDAGTLNVDFYHAASHFLTVKSFNASTTIGTVPTTANTTDTTGDVVKVDFGTPATSPTTITCTVNDTI